MVNPISMFQRAFTGQPLSPAERALMKLLKGSLMTFLVAMLPIITAASQQENVNWGHVILMGMGAGLVACGHAWDKYYSAKGDANTAALIGAATDKVQAWAGVPAPKDPLALPDYLNSDPAATAPVAPAPVSSSDDGVAAPVADPVVSAA